MDNNIKNQGVTCAYNNLAIRVKTCDTTDTSELAEHVEVLSVYYAHR